MEKQSPLPGKTPRHGRQRALQLLFVLAVIPLLLLGIWQHPPLFSYYLRLGAPGRTPRPMEPLGGPPLLDGQ